MLLLNLMSWRHWAYESHLDFLAPTLTKLDARATLMSLAFWPDIVLVICGPIRHCKVADHGFKVFKPFSRFSWLCNPCEGSPQLLDDYILKSCRLINTFCVNGQTATEEKNFIMTLSKPRYAGMPQPLLQRQNSGFICVNIPVHTTTSQSGLISTPQFSIDLWADTG